MGNNTINNANTNINEEKIFVVQLINEERQLEVMHILAKTHEEAMMKARARLSF